MTEEEKESTSIWEALGFFLTHWTALKAIVAAVMLVLGYGTATNETVQEYFRPAQVDVPAGSLADAQPGQVDYSVQINAINAKLLEHDEELKAINARRIGGDKALEERVTELESHH